MKSVIMITLSLIMVAGVKAQEIKRDAKPKLVVGLVIDQMRWDYLHRYADRYGNDGFKRLMNEGFNCNSTFINYTPTYTAAGHATIYTGSVPAFHGIMGNHWYSRILGRNVYCTEDSTVSTVGSSSVAGRMSPTNLQTNTISDEVRLSNNFRGKVIGVALKDRGSVLPAGHSANAAYWFDNASGNFISSTYYMSTLPTWVNQFNNKNFPDKYLQQNWNTLYPINTYTQSSTDDKPYENNLPGEDNTFPHITSNITRDKYNSFRYTPYANTYTLDMAMAAIEGEDLGSDEHTDVLAVSCSATDYLGHEFGPNSIEIEDTYLRLDKDIAEFLKYLDKKIGKDQYVLFLSADHGVAHVPGFLRENRIPAGVLGNNKIETRISKFLEEKFKISNGLSKIVNYQVYLNHDAIEVKDLETIKKLLIAELMKEATVANAYDLANLATASIPHKLKHMMTNGYNQRLSGDIQLAYKAQYYDSWEKGTSHGVWNNFDSHIPLIWFGKGIKKGNTYRTTYMTDIAATLAAILKVQVPNGCIGDVIEEVIR